MSIASELQNYNDGLLDAYTAVNTKGGTVPEAKNLDNLDTAIASIPAGGTSDVDKDIRFYDYDGTLVEAWSLAELQEKTELPANPTHTGLTSLGWNWTLAQLKSENARMTVGQLYEPTDAKTHIFVTLINNSLEPMLGLGVNGTVTIDWGDSSATDTLTGTSVSTLKTVTHLYSAEGSYEVTITPNTGTEFNIRGESNGTRLWTNTSGQAGELNSGLYYSEVKEIWCGEGCIIDGGLYALSINQIVLGKKAHTGSNFCRSIQSLKCIIIPPEMINVYYFLNNGYAGNYIVSLPPTITDLGAYFMSSTSMQKFEVNIPSSVTTIGQYFLQGTGLTKVTIPSSVTSIGQYPLSSANRLQELIVNTTTAPTNGITCGSSLVPAFSNGVIVKGTGTTAWLTALPNVYATSNPRKLINGTV